MHGDDTILRPAHADEGPGARSPAMDAALDAGSLIGAALDPITREHLPDAARRRVRSGLAAAAAASTYAGMALWALNAATAKHDGAARAAETIAGLGAGLLAQGHA